MQDSDQAGSTAQRVQELLGRMTLSEKVGQMTQVEKNSLPDGVMAEFGIGSVLSGGGGNPEPNTPENWRAMVESFLTQAKNSRLGIPAIYGTDAVHGHNNCVGATIFPHNIGLGAALDADLVRRVAQATAREVRATAARWNFAPAVSIPYDIRWGRTYEGYSQSADIVSEMGAAYVKGLIDEGVLPSVKHYVADGGTTWGSSTRLTPDQWETVENDPTLANANLGEWMMEYLKLGAWKIDQGVSEIDEELLRRVFLPPYIAAIEAGTKNIMVSYSSWDGLKMHAQHYLLTEVLKGELGFDGFLVTDWEAIDQIDKNDFYTCVVESINAGIDMVMVPFNYERFVTTLTKAVTDGDISIDRIDDAVSRILTVKFDMGLFDEEDGALPLDLVGCDAHRVLAREAVRRSAVLLKNEANLPLSKSVPTLFVAGEGSHDIGYQCGGWTIEWMGKPGPITPGTTLLEGIQATVSADTAVHHSATGEFDESLGTADVAIVAIAEHPYAEGMGDRSDLNLSAEQTALLDRVRARCNKLVVIVMTGRPLIITEQLEQWDSFICAWLPGSEGNGLSDVLFGDYPFTGKMTYTWPRSMAQIPLNTDDGQPPLFTPGDGITTN